MLACESVVKLLLAAQNVMVRTKAADSVMSRRQMSTITLHCVPAQVYSERSEKIGQTTETGAFVSHISPFV